MLRIPLLGICFLTALATVHAVQRGAPSGWADLLPPRQGYDLQFKKPTIDGEKYSQKAEYLWTGGRIDTLDVIFLRDPAVKDRYSDEAMKKDKHGPTGLVVNKKQTWHWIYARDESKEIRSKLVVILSPDKAMILEQKYHDFDLQEFAKKLDYAKIEKAMANPPKLEIK